VAVQAVRPAPSTTSIVRFCAGRLSQYWICAVPAERIAAAGLKRYGSGDDAMAGVICRSGSMLSST
jgi:hypothetical protein